MNMSFISYGEATTGTVTVVSERSIMDQTRRWPEI